MISNVVRIESLGKSMLFLSFILKYSCCVLQTRCTVCIFLALSLYLSKLQLICQAQQALATFKSFVLSLLLRLMRARDSNLSSICYFVSKFCIASVCICAITPTEVYEIKGCKQGSGWWPDDLLNVLWTASLLSNHLLGGGALTEDNESAGFKSFFYMFIDYCTILSLSPHLQGLSAIPESEGFSLVSS